MKSVFVCQLTQEEQKAIRTMLTDIILHGCGNDPAKVQEHYGVTLDEAVQTGMDSKVVDLDSMSSTLGVEKTNGSCRGGSKGPETAAF